GGCPHVEGGKSQVNRLVGNQFVDIVGRNFGLHTEYVVIWNNQHKDLARLDHPTNCVHRQFMHPPGLRRANVDMLELVFGSDFALAEFRNFGADVAQLLRCLAADVLIDLDYLQLNLSSFASGFSFRGDELPPFTTKSGSITLE